MRPIELSQATINLVLRMLGILTLTCVGSALWLALTGKNADAMIALAGPGIGALAAMLAKLETASASAAPVLPPNDTSATGQAGSKDVGQRSGG